LRGQDLNLRPSGYENPEEGLQAASASTNSSQSLDRTASDSVPPMQPDAAEHKHFGQPVVSEFSLTPAQAAAQFEVPEHLLRRACAEGRLEHLRVVNALWLKPITVASFAESLRVGRKQK